MMNVSRWHWPWKRNSWKVLLYLTILVFISSRLLIGQGFSLTLSSVYPGKAEAGNQLNNIAIPKHGERGLKMAVTSSTWSANVAGESASIDDAIAVNVDSNDNQMNVPKIVEETTYKEVKEKPASINHQVSRQEQEYRYWLRSERIKQVCRSKGVVSNPPVFVTSQNQSVRSPSEPDSLTTETPVTSHFSLAPSFQTMGCFLNKVASSSLVSAFLILHGLEPSFTSPHSLTFHLFPRSLEDFRFSNQTFFKFIFVRHPMDRMLSCYLDKMVESPHFSLPAFRRYVRRKARIIMFNRKRLLQQPPKRRLLSIRDWIRPDLSNQIVYGRRIDQGNDTADHPAELTETVKLHSYVAQGARISPKQVIDKSKPDASENLADVKPTFEEFLEFVLDTDLQGQGYDSHWVPYHRYCTPCSVPYHVVGKLETAAEDFQYIWSKTGLDTQVPVPWINRNTVAPSKSKIALEKKYYSSLPRELILRFYNAFRMDFEMFDYSINDILLKGGHDLIDDQVPWT